MVRRNIDQSLRDALSDTPVVLLHGARQTGKSTLARALEGPDRRDYLTLDDATLLAAARSDPAGFIAALAGPAVLDEVQRAPDLFLAIKAEVDRQRRPGRFLLTGSANVLRSPRLAESLAGRVEIVTLWPLSQGEIQGRREGFIDALFSAELPAAPPHAGGLADAAARIVRGGFPEVVQREAESRRAAWFGAYLTTVLQRDVRDLANIEGLAVLPRVLALLASRAGTLLNTADLSRALAIPLTTLKRYLSLLEATFFVANLPAWSTDLGLRLVKSPKVYLADTGLACHLLGLTPQRLAADPVLLGPLLENFVVMELRKQAAWSRTRVSLFHYRTFPGREADVVLEAADGRLVGIDVKAGAGVRAEDFKGLQALRDAAGPRFHRGVVLHAGPAAAAFGDRTAALPLPTLWLA